MDNNKKTFSKKIAFLFGQIEFKFMVFLTGIFILCWPFIILLHKKPVSYPFKFYFIVWAVLVLLLLIASLGKGDDSED